jgi:hypothetical protein
MENKKVTRKEFEDRTEYLRVALTSLVIVIDVLIQKIKTPDEVPGADMRIIENIISETGLSLGMQKKIP